MEHIPVLLAETLELLHPQKGESVLDVTLGLGGHARAFLERIGPNGTLIGLDTDAENLHVAQERLGSDGAQVRCIHANFRTIHDVELPNVDILFADLGISSPHVDDPQRGFSFRADAPLDLRFDRTRGKTAAQFVAAASEQELATILKIYGEVRQGKRLAVLLKQSSVVTTTDLKECVERVCGFRTASVLPQVFQALRIAVNEELDALRILLEEGPQLLASGGRMGVISYHSLEDRLVKQAFRALGTPVKNEQTGAIEQESKYEVLTKKPVRSTPQEVERNPRSRSARLRILRKRS